MELLRHWSGKQFGADDGDWKKELGSWSKWFNQTFPKEPPLPDVAGGAPVVSKYKYDELLLFLTEKDGKAGDPVKGKEVFTKRSASSATSTARTARGSGRT